MAIPTLVRAPAAERAPTLVLAHGAGAPMDSPFLEDVTARLVARGLQVVRFEFPYMAKRRTGGGRGGPDRMPVLEACYREVVAQLGEPSRLFIGGKSMGGRVATLVADALGVRGVVVLGYPFHPPRRPESLRVAHLRVMRTPCLVVQGERDPFGTREEIAGYGLPSSIEVTFAPDGDHSLEPRKRSGRTLEQNLDEAAAAVAGFVARVRV